jgi:polar amino acid transport system substrate-binding protein
MRTLTRLGRALSLAVLLSVGIATLTSCGLGSSPSQPKAGADAQSTRTQTKDESLAAMLPADIKQSGVIRMAINPAYPPFESVDTDGKTLAGLDPDLAHAMGDLLGVKIEFVPTSFDAIIPALAAKKVDMAMSSIGDTKEREQTVDFATYYWNGTLILVNKGNPKGIKADLACGASIGVIRGSLQQNTFLPSQAPRCTAAGREPPNAQAYQDGPQAQLALASKRIDGVMLDAPPLLDAAQKNPQEFETVGPLVKNPNPGGVAFPKGSELEKPINGAINKLIENGTYEDIMKRWNLDAIKIDKSQIDGAVS